MSGKSTSERLARAMEALAIAETHKANSHEKLATGVTRMAESGEKLMDLIERKVDSAGLSRDDVVLWATELERAARSPDPDEMKKTCLRAAKALRGAAVTDDDIKKAVGAILGTSLEDWAGAPEEPAP